MSRGKYIVIEGNDGTGKSTQVQLLIDYLNEQGIETVEYQEPAGTPTTDAIRKVILNGELKRDSTTNLLLFTAARHEIWNKAESQLSSGSWVVASRNYFSTLAYQGYGEGLDLDLIVNTTTTFTSESYMQPDLAIILTLDHEARTKRIQGRGEITQPDTFESRSTDFQERVSNAYVEIAKQRNIPLVDADRTPHEIADDIRVNHISKLFV